MNNSFHVDLNEDFSEKSVDKTPLREREAKIVRTLEALGALVTSPEWSTLKDEMFDSALESIETRIRVEAQKPLIDTSELYRLQGERKWAKRFCDPLTMIGNYRAELANIRKQLNPSGPTE